MRDRPELGAPLPFQTSRTAPSFIADSGDEKKLHAKFGLEVFRNFHPTGGLN